MDISKDDSVRNFLNKLEIIDPNRIETVLEMRKIIFNFIPNANEKKMYGGIVFFINAEMFSGIFVNKKHITLEFSRGFLMTDPDKRLEGTGKYRRHLKIKTHIDILNKEVAFFVKQAVE